MSMTDLNTEISKPIGIYVVSSCVLSTRSNKYNFWKDVCFDMWGAHPEFFFRVQPPRKFLKRNLMTLTLVEIAVAFWNPLKKNLAGHGVANGPLESLVCAQPGCSLDVLTRPLYQIDGGKKFVRLTAYSVSIYFAYYRV